MRLFKYTSRAGMLAIVRGSSLLVRPLNGFNDPFESVPALTDEGATIVATRLLENSSSLRRLADDSELNPGGFSAPQLRIRLRESEFRKHTVEALLKRSKTKPIEFALSLQDWFSEHAGLVCFTDRPSSILMWAHYAEQHLGYVFLIDTGIWNQETITRVDYSGTRSRFPSDPPTPTELKEIVTRKSLEWEYESEYRMLCQVDNWQDLDGKPVDYLSIQAGQILGICAGVRTTEVDIEDLRTGIESSTLGNIPVYHATLHSTEFRLCLPDEFEQASRAI